MKIVARIILALVKAAAFAFVTVGIWVYIAIDNGVAWNEPFILLMVAVPVAVALGAGSSSNFNSETNRS